MDSQYDIAGVNWRGCRVTVMGLGRHGGGSGAARYLARHGARVVVSDRASETELAHSILGLSDVPIAAFHLGGHNPRDFADADYVVVNPAVRPGNPLVELARNQGAQITTEIELFLAACTGNVIGVTGTTGKSTTSAMLADMLRASGRCTWLGGNFGGSLLNDLSHMSRDDWVVLELSSFQLAQLNAAARWPRWAVVTNCSTNHLDWHGDSASYAKAKQRLLIEQPRGGLCVLNACDLATAAWSSAASGNIRWSWPLERIQFTKLTGAHNRENAACAAAAAEAAGVDEATILAALARFRGLEHRLEPVAIIAGRQFVNDSKATSPAATIAALGALAGPLWLLAGGAVARADWRAWAEAVVARANGAALFGAARHELAKQLCAQQPSFHWIECQSLAEALDWCWQLSRDGDTILCSPACASHDQFQDYSQRGDAFRALVARIEANESRAARHGAHKGAGKNLQPAAAQCLHRT